DTCQAVVLLLDLSLSVVEKKTKSFDSSSLSLFVSISSSLSLRLCLSDRTSVWISVPSRNQRTLVESCDCLSRSSPTPSFDCFSSSGKLRQGRSHTLYGVGRGCFLSLTLLLACLRNISRLQRGKELSKRR
ncbi:unnamed protein product, partial [Brassica rapa subsp. narinosa]